MNKDIILQEFEETFSDLESAINLFDDKKFNEVPFEGSWTPGQVVQHIVLSSAGFAQVLNAEVKETDRAIDELIPELKSIFLNFGLKMKSPDFILPELKDYDREAFLVKVKEIRQAIGKAISALPLDKTCLAFQLPGMGYLTRLEAVHFVIYHTQRHIHQLRSMKQFLKLS